MNDLIMRAQIYFTIFMRRKSFIKEEHPIHNCLDFDNSWKSGFELTCIVSDICSSRMRAAILALEAPC